MTMHCCELRQQNHSKLFTFCKYHVTRLHSANHKHRTVLRVYDRRMWWMNTRPDLTWLDINVNTDPIQGGGEEQDPTVDKRWPKVCLDRRIPVSVELLHGRQWHHRLQMFNCVEFMLRIVKIREEKHIRNKQLASSWPRSSDTQVNIKVQVWVISTDWVNIKCLSRWCDTRLVT